MKTKHIIILINVTPNHSQVSLSRLPVMDAVFIHHNKQAFFASHLNILSENKCLFVRFAQRKLVGHLFWLAGPVFQPPHWIRDTFPLPGQAAIRARKSGNSPGTRVVLFSLVSALGLSPRFGPKSNSKMPFDHYHHQIRKKWWILAAKLQVGSWAGSSILIKFPALVAT